MSIICMCIFKKVNKFWIWEYLMIQRCLGDAWRFSDHTFIRILLRWTDHVTFGWVIEVKKAQDGRKFKKRIRRVLCWWQRSCIGFVFGGKVALTVIIPSTWPQCYSCHSIRISFSAKNICAKWVTIPKLCTGRNSPLWE